MEKNSDKSVDKQSSAAAAIERGKAAIKIDEKVNNESDNTEVKDQKEKDTEQWRNEG